MKSILVVENNVCFASKLYKTKVGSKCSVGWAKDFNHLKRWLLKEVFNFIIINTEIPESDFFTIKEMIKKTKVIILFSLDHNTEQIENFIDDDVNKNFFYVKDEEGAIQTVLDCLK